MQARKQTSKASLSSYLEKLHSANTYWNKCYCVSAQVSFQTRLKYPCEARIQALKKNKQSKSFYIYIESRLDLYISGKVLLCICVPACLCPVIDSTKIDSRSEDSDSKNREVQQVYIYLQREQTQLIYIGPSVTVSLTACLLVPGYRLD